MIDVALEAVIRKDRGIVLIPASSRATFVLKGHTQ